MRIYVGQTKDRPTWVQRSLSLRERGWEILPPGKAGWTLAIKLGKAGVLQRAYTGFSERSKRVVKQSWAPRWATILARDWTAKRIKEVWTSLGPAASERLNHEPTLIAYLKRGYDPAEVLAMLRGRW